MDIFVDTVNEDDYIIATYHLSSTVNVADAAWNIATGQSIGNPTIRSKWETEELFRNHSCLVLHKRHELEPYKNGIVRIAFPITNFGIGVWAGSGFDGVSHLLCLLMGGHLDIDSIVTCRLLHVKYPVRFSFRFQGPLQGLSGIRKFTGVHDKPLVGGIIKPKIITDKETLLRMVKELVEGGVNFIKEDECHSGADVCPLAWRLSHIRDYLADKKVVYCACINGDPSTVMRRFEVARDYVNGVHVNFWSGLGIYRELREANNPHSPMFIHFQKSGDKILTDKRNVFSIDWRVICELAAMSGVDTIHVGGYGSYSDSDEVELKDAIALLHKHNTLPAISCGMHPGLVESTRKKFGDDVLLNVGGALHGHPGGTKAGAMAMVQAINREYGKEYNQAIDKWGLVQ